MDVKDIKTVGVLGAGVMGQGIIQNYAQAGLKVLVYYRNPEKLDASLKQIEENLKLFKQYGLLKEEVATVMARLEPALISEMEESVKRCDLVLETISEKLELKQEFFAKMDAARADNILASNTGSLKMDAISANMKHPERAIGVHYFNPAHIMPLVEIHYGSKTSEETIQATKAFMENIGKEPVVIRKVLPGLIANRIGAAMGREIEYLLAEGVCTAEEIDRVARGLYGFRAAVLGAIEGYDMIGLDILAAVSGSVYSTLDNSKEAQPFLKQMVAEGRLGVKAGKGYYDYSNTTRAEILDKQNKKLLKQLALYEDLKQQGKK